METQKTKAGLVFEGVGAIIRSYLKNVFWPNLGVGRHVLVGNSEAHQN